VKSPRPAAKAKPARAPDQLIRASKAGRIRLIERRPVLARITRRAK